MTTLLALVVVALPPMQGNHENPVARLVRMPWKASISLGQNGQEKEWLGFSPGISFDRIMPAWNGAVNPAVKVEVQMRVGAGAWISALTLDKSTASVPLSSAPLGEFKLKELTETFDLRVRSYGGPLPPYALIAVSVANSTAMGPSAAPKRDESWGKDLGVVLDHELPSSLSSELKCAAALQGYWAKKFLSNDLRLTKDEISQYLPQGEAKKTAHLGALAACVGSNFGIYAYPTRFVSISDLQLWIRQSVPVTCLLSDRKGRHAVLVKGFTIKGDPIVVDPDAGQNRLILDRNIFEKAWFATGKTVFLNYLASFDTPTNSRGLWIERHVGD